MWIFRYSFTMFGVALILSAVLLEGLGVCLLFSPHKPYKSKIMRLASMTSPTAVGVIVVAIMSRGFNFHNVDPELFRGFLQYSLFFMVGVYVIYILGFAILWAMEVLEGIHSKEDK